MTSSYYAIEFSWPDGEISEIYWKAYYRRRTFPPGTTLQSLLPHNPELLVKLSEQAQRLNYRRFTVAIRAGGDPSFHVCLTAGYHSNATLSLRSFHGQGRSLDSALEQVLVEIGRLASQHVLFNELAKIRRAELAIEAGDDARAMAEIESLSEEMKEVAIKVHGEYSD